MLLTDVLHRASAAHPRRDSSGDRHESGTPRLRLPPRAGAPPVAVVRHHLVMRIFHRVIAILVFVLFPEGIAMTSGGFEAWDSSRLFILHKGLGTVLLATIALRVVWCLAYKPPPPPPSMTGVQRLLAGSPHAFLYLLPAAMAVSGYVLVVSSGFPIEQMDRLDLATLLPEMPELADPMSVLHKSTAYLFAATIAAHIAAAVHHAVSPQDGVLSRMGFPLRYSR